MKVTKQHPYRLVITATNIGTMKIGATWMYEDHFLHCRRKITNFLFQTSQDPSSPNAAESAPASTSNNLAAGNLLDLRDGWDNEEWGSLEEEPVRRTSSLFFLPFCYTNFFDFRMKNRLT